MPWNFAYGSNLHPARLRGRANIEPRRVEPAVLRNWRLAFNLATGLHWVEPAMANIVSAPGDTVHGIALEMSSDELERLTESEGGVRFYHSVVLPIETYDGEQLNASAFVARADVVRDEVPPSIRYLRLLREGARHHALDAGYCDFLDRHASAPPSSAGPWVARLFRLLERPNARLARRGFVRLIHQVARMEARLAKRRGTSVPSIADVVTKWLR